MCWDPTTEVSAQSEHLTYVPGGADEAEQAWRIDQGSYLPRVESPGAAAPTTDFGSVSVWGWKRVGSSAELNTFLLLVSPLQCLGTPVVLLDSHRPALAFYTIG